ncbi:unnamed protein product [Amaranthus hypochondriacus]
MGHDCKDTTMEAHPQSKQKSSEENNGVGDKRMWIPTSIAKVMQGITTMKELREKLTSDTNIVNEESAGMGNVTMAEDSTPTDVQPAATDLVRIPGTASNNDQHAHVQQDEEGWTPILPAKAARRGQLKPPNSYYIPQVAEVQGEINIPVSRDTDQYRDGNPLIPSPK